MKKIIGIISFCICLFSICDTLAYKNVYAIVVGVSDYKENGANDLHYADKDARCFYDFLTSDAGGNVPPSHIKLLVNGNATKSNILYYAKQLFEKANPDDRIYFFFSGHGVPGYFLPTDATFFGENYLAVDEVKALFRLSRAKTKLIFADACFSGKFTLPRSSSSTSVHGTADTDIAIMLSCSEDEGSLESPLLEQGVFTYYLLEGLRGAADRDSTKKITIQELFYYVHKNVKEYGRMRNVSQTPVLRGNFDKTLIIGYIR